MKILPQFLHKQVLIRTLGIFLLGNMMLFTNQLLLTFGEILDGDLSLIFLWNISMLFLIFKSGFLLSSCYLLALLFFMAKLYEKNEIYIMKNIGIGEGKLFFWLSLPSAFISLIVGVLVFYFAPISTAEIDKIYSNGLSHKFQNLGEGDFDFSDSYSFRITDNNLEIWSIHPEQTLYNTGKLDEDNPPHWEAGSFKIPLNAGRSLSWSDDGSVVETNFATADINLYSDSRARRLISSVQSAPSLDLLQEELSRSNRDTKEGIRRRVEFYERLVVFISSLFMLPLALAVSRRKARSGASRNVFLGLLMYFGYLVLIFSSVGIIRNGGSAWAFWISNLAFITAIIASLMSALIYSLISPLMTSSGARSSKRLKDIKVLNKNAART